jgi:hypothetical protein
MPDTTTLDMTIPTTTVRAKPLILVMPRRKRKKTTEKRSTQRDWRIKISSWS